MLFAPPLTVASWLLAVLPAPPPTVEDQLLALARSGRLGKQVTDGELRAILRRLAEVRKSGAEPKLGPDAKSQLTVRYENGVPVAVTSVVLSTQHNKASTQAELRELGRVTKPGGMVIDCPGEDDRKQPDGPNPDLVERGFCWSHYVSKYGGDVYRYWKQL